MTTNRYPCPCIAAPGRVRCTKHPVRGPGVIGTEDEYYAEMEAVHDGLASELFRCPVDDSLQGVDHVKHVRPTSHNAFDGGDVITLRCGHVVL